MKKKQKNADRYAMFTWRFSSLLASERKMHILPGPKVSYRVAMITSTYSCLPGRRLYLLQHRFALRLFPTPHLFPFLPTFALTLGVLFDVVHELLSLLGLRMLVVVLGDDVPAAHLPFHEFREGAVGPVAEFGVGALLGHFAVGGEHDDGVGAFDGRKPVGDADGRVVAAEEGRESAVDEGFRFGVEGGGGWESMGQ